METATRLPHGPGKTAPRLIADLLDYDPRSRKGRSSRNLLADPAQQFKGYTIYRKREQDCRHSLMRKDEQTCAAPRANPDAPGPTDKYVVASFCTKCKYHFHISVNFKARKNAPSVCRLSDKENPIHHLRLVESDVSNEAGEHAPYGSADSEHYLFACSASQCPAQVLIHIFPPRLDSTILAPISSNEVLRRRGEKVIQENPERYDGMRPLRVTQVYCNLRQYLKDSKDAPGRSIARRNKKYCLAFDDDADDLLRFLGFNATQKQNEEEGYDYFWQLPTITESNRNFIDDVIFELSQLISETPSETINQAKETKFTPVPASRDIEQSLGYFGYPTRGRTVDLTTEEHPHYASLGALEYFTDELLGWAYERQTLCDPANKPYYLDCLYDIATGRKSSDLETQVLMVTSTGELRLSEILKAYDFFAISPHTTEDDDHIIGVFKSRIQSAPRQAAEARECLKIIGTTRNSKSIMAASNNTELTYEGALALVGVSEGATWDNIAAYAQFHFSDESDLTLLERKRIPEALLIIGKEFGTRKSDHESQTGLLEAAFTMFFNSPLYQQDVSDAYRSLQVTTTVNAPDTLVWNYYKHLGAHTEHTRAVFIIAMSRKSKYLLCQLDPDLVPGGIYSSVNHPIGLDNIGNTCYLNSILQYYYTVKSIQEVVTKADTYCIDLSSSTVDEDIGKKVVGGRRISRAEVENAQKFVYGLKDLFEQLRTAPTSSVRPTNELASLTLLSDQKVAAYRRDSVTSPDGPPPLQLPSAKSSDQAQSVQLAKSVAIPPKHTLPPTPEDDIEMVDNPTETQEESRDDRSDSTLVDGDTPSEQEREQDEKTSLLQTTPKSIDLDDDIVMVNSDNTTGNTAKGMPEPEKPPPVPPRNKVDTGLWDLGAQQDVTEVVGNVLFRLQCAIKAAGIDQSSGEQSNIISDTFYGASTTYTQKLATLEKKVEPWANLIIYPDPAGPRDIYAALDVTFDAQTVDVDGKQSRQYSAIADLPPILHLHIQRTAFDPINKVPMKNMNAVHFPETLYMDRYMDGEDTLLKRREQAWEWKAQLEKLEKRHSILQSTGKMSVNEALIAASRFVSQLQELDIEGIEIDPSLPDTLEQRIPEIRAEVESLETRITSINQKLKEQFTDMTKHEYQLQTVFIHRGESGSGHYWIYVYDFENSLWREYNDGRVSEIHDINQIFHKDGSREGTPYYLAYVRSADKDRLVSAVVRDVPEQPVVEVNYAEVPEKDSDENFFSGTTSHVEHVQPRSILPKPTATVIAGWDDGHNSGTQVKEPPPW